VRRRTPRTRCMVLKVAGESDANIGAEREVAVEGRRYSEAAVGVSRMLSERMRRFWRRMPATMDIEQRTRCETGEYEWL
jgi:hypothetical protein